MGHTSREPQIHGTTVLCVRKESKVVLIADGQVTMGDHVIKHTAKKTRRLYNDKVVAGFAGSTADAISLFERFEGKLQEHSGNLQKAAVELAKEWRIARCGTLRRCSSSRTLNPLFSFPATATSSSRTMVCAPSVPAAALRWPRRAP